ncbi:hypothetical protein FACS1894123_04140 [Bacteroidia bacterium]|nr:hypothetical protein FACS1894123_04140 [Bacteroidia bacterium]
MGIFSQFSDNFNDGQFRSVQGQSQNREVEWTGDVDKFVVNDALQLQLNAPSTGSPAQLRTSSQLSANAFWEFWMKMDFNPTASNYSKVFLCSDETDLSGDLNGLFVRLGYSNKSVALIQSQKGKNNKTLIEGTSKRLDKSSVSLNVKATLDKKGKLSLYSKLDDESDYVLEGSCNVTELPESQQFGLVCYFSSTRNKAFYFDDFVARELGDDEQDGDTGDGDSDGDSDGDGDGDDGDGDTDPDPDPESLQEGDVIFSEIMANPSGSEPEYIELYNKSDKSFDLKNCLYYYGEKSYKLPQAIIGPKTYFVLSKTTTTATFPEGTQVFGVSSFPTLANTGKLLMFATDKEELVSWFEYSDQMYGDNTKKTGGWSLECIDLENVSNTASNWIASDVEGGTPGRENSVKSTNPDTELPKVTGVQTQDENNLLLNFSKPMNRRTLSDVSAYLLSDSRYTIENIQTNYPKGTEATIQFSALPAPGNLIELALDGIRDLTGLALEDKQILLGSGNEAAPDEIVINEILFNPPTGGNEYVEIYNKSDKAFDLRFLSITSRKPSDGSFNKLYPLSEKPLLLNPNEYLVITKSKELICSFFDCRPSSSYAELSVMPSLANASGCAVLLNNRTNEVIDEFAYNENMHAKGISSKKGVSLERIDFNLPSNDTENWHSASSESGFGTPGYQNSQHTTTGIDESIQIEYPSIGSDEYYIYYRFQSPGYRCKSLIYDSMGRTVGVIANNELLGTEGKLTWNGKGNSGKTLTSGIYILYVEVYNSKGIVKKYKKPVVVK